MLARWAKAIERSRSTSATVGAMFGVRTATALITRQWLTEYELRSLTSCMTSCFDILIVSRLSAVTIMVLQVKLAVNKRVDFVIDLDSPALLVCNDQSALA